MPNVVNKKNIHKKKTKMRVNFQVRLFGLQLHLEPKYQEGKETEKPLPRTSFLNVECDFAKYKKIVFDHWIPTTQENKWKHDLYTKDSPFVFTYRTDYAPLLEPKEVKILVSDGKVSLGNIGISLHTLATGPQEYHLHLTLSPATPFRRITLFFMCYMSQECSPQYRILSMSCPPLVLPIEVRQHPNAFWFDPEFAIHVWYVNSESMTWKQRREGAFQSLSANISWQDFPAFSVTDTTIQLDHAHLFLQLSFTDRPLGYALLPLFQNYHPRGGEFSFQVPLFLYETYQPSSLTLVIQITQGPLFWPMKNGIATEVQLLSGTCKAHFPKPKLANISSRRDSPLESSTPIIPVLTNTFLIPEFLRWIPPPILLNASPTLHHIDDSQRALLESYIQQGLSKEEIQQRLLVLLVSL